MVGLVALIKPRRTLVDEPDAEKQIAKVSLFRTQKLPELSINLEVARRLISGDQFG